MLEKIEEPSKKYYVKGLLNKDIVLLFCISKIYKLDMIILMMLYEKYEKDLIYIFYLFSGKKITLPTATKLQALMFSSENIYKFLKNKEVELQPDEEDLAVELSNIFDADKQEILLPLEVIYNQE